MCYNIIEKGYKCLGKKTNPQPVHSLGPENIRWTNLSTGRKGNRVAIASTQKRCRGARVLQRKHIIQR
jgi:hypothetical protein